MKQYPESESLAIKRLKVSIEKKNWDLFESGLAKAYEMKEFGHQWKNLDLWQKLLLWAESEDIPPNLWEKFSDFVNDISGSIYEEPELFELEGDEKREIVKLTDVKTVIFYNRFYSKDTYAFIKKHRVNLVNYSYYKSKYLTDYDWFNELSSLINEFNNPAEDLKGFISLLSSCSNEGSVITTGYDTNILKMFVKSNKKFYYPGISQKKIQPPFWNLYPLGGTINTFVCTECNSRILKTDFTARTLVESCHKCSAVMLPDLSDISAENSEVNPRLWYDSFEKLVNNKVWVLINPPSLNESSAVKNLILDSARVSQVEEVYIISTKPEVYEWWRSKLLSFSKGVQVRGNFAGISSLLESRKN